MPKHKSTNLFIVGCASVISRVSGLLTTIVTAWYLSPAEYGLYAIVLGITTFTTIFRGGGTSTLFPTMKPEEWRTVGGGLFLYSMIFGLLGAVLTLGAALPTEFLYPPEAIRGLGWLLAITSIQFIVFTASNFPRMMMASKLMFSQVAAMDITASLVKFGVAFYCASHGFGAMSFVISVLANSLTVLIWATLKSGITWQNLTVAPDWIPRTLSLIKIPFLIAIVNSLGSQPDFLIASFFIPISSLGIYSFASQMAIQPVLLVSGTLQNVLSPYAAQIRGHDDSENEHIRQTFLTGIVFVPIFVMAVAAMYPSMVHLLFLEKWDASIMPVTFASILLIFPTVQILLEAPIMGARRWWLTLRLFGGRALAKITGALLAVGAIFAFDIPDVHKSTAVIIGVGLAATMVSLLQIYQVTKQVKLPAKTFRYEIYSTPMYAILAAIATSGLAESVVGLLHIASITSRLESLLEFLFCLAAYSTINLVLLRFGYIENLHNILILVPSGIRSRLYRLMLLEEPNRAQASPSPQH
ncbi:MAG: oligosaccharide flippase family protein [Planctomycetes bacterium]|nr:oligosaccharide flippase family protein [Planctomycetota bacterium]